MSVIKILDSHTINKIAAGEVVERPISVVKELVENSIDAKASSITVEIKNGGVDFIRVTDNGTGIKKEEVELAFLRHATSKITRSEDLYEVVSLGFRGEALASIASVSYVELITKQQGELTGKRVEVAGGKIVTSEEIAAPEGTTFIMRELFYNVPARKEFLKSATAEAGKISDAIYKLALAHPEISFKYIVNNKLVFHTVGNHDLQNCTFHLYGKEVAKNTLKLYYEAENIEVFGLLGNTTVTRGNRNHEHFFINGRYIKDYTIQRAVEDAYKTLVTIGKFPFIILHLKINPSLVDVNVHPTKMEVRFKDQNLIYDVVYRGITEQLQKENLVPTISIAEKRETIKVPPKYNNTQLFVDTFFTPRKENNTPTPKTLLATEPKAIAKGKDFLTKEEKFFTTNKIEDNNLVETKVSKEQLLEDKLLEDKLLEDKLLEDKLLEDKLLEDKLLKEQLLEKKLPKDKVLEAERTPASIEVTSPVATHKDIIMEEPSITFNQEQPGATDKVLLPYTIIGQIFTTYWIIEYNNEVFIMDQHAAHERVMYERFMKQFTEGTVQSQVLLLPETLTVTMGEKLFIEENKHLLEKLGFGLEFFGENAIMIREVPYIFNQPLGVDAFKNILDSMDTHTTKSIYEIKAASLIQYACKSAIKAHDKISLLECQNLIEELLTMENPFTCPHGRPTMITLSKTDMEKMFKRIQ